MKGKRIIVVLLALCLLLSLAPVSSALAADSHTKKLAPSATENGTGQTITRAEWISNLVSTFDMSVAEENAPDNYYSDMTGDESYYRDILIATSFGIIDVEAGMPFEPEKPATREFAARTLNACLLLQLDEGTTYTFSEASSVDYPDDIQVAINRGWFALQNGKFLPNQAITAAESDKMLADAKTILGDLEIDENYNSVYKYKVGVVEVPDGTMVSTDADDTVRIENCPVSLKAGDLFVVYFGGIPCAYSAKEVSKDNNVTVVKAISIDDGSIFEDVDAQGSVEAEFTQFVPYEGTEVVYINEITQEEFTDPVKAEKSVKAATVMAASSGIKRSLSFKNTVKLSNTISASVSITIKDPKIDFKFSLKDKVAEVIISGKYEVSIKAKADFTDSFATKELQLCLFGVHGIGGIEFAMVYDLSGGGAAVYSGGFSYGLSYTKDSGASLIRNFTSDSFSLELDAKFKSGIQVSIGVNDIPDDIISGYIYFEIGPCGKIKRVQYPDHEAPAVCLHTAMYLYLEGGYKAAFKFGILKQEFEAKVEIWNDKNSPIRVVHHYEDGVEVPKCTRDNPEFKNFFTSSNSRWNGGWSGRNGAYGLDANGEPIQLYTYELDSNGDAIITGYKGNASALSIPEYLDGHKVVAIGEAAFKGLSQICSIMLPDSITDIEDSAFFGCTNLREITLPEGLKELGGLSFAHCTSLTYVFIPKTITKCSTDAYSSGYSIYEGGPFYKCEALRNVKFADGITAIPENLFYGCNGLESITIPETVTLINDFAFYMCSKLSNVCLPSNLNELGPFSFGKCTALRSISIPASLKKSPLGTIAEGYNTYDGGPFYLCSNLKSVELPEGMSYIPENLFYACTGLETVKIPNTVVEIRENAFRGCTSLKSVDFSDSVTSIGATAFFGDESLKEIVLPKNLKTLTGHAFSKCTNLESVYIPKSIENCTYESYQSGLNLIKGGPFYLCSKLNNITFEDGVTRILPNLFFGCTGLREITIPETVTEIGANAFNSCANLNSVVFPEKLEAILGYAFYKCNSLESVVIPDSVKSMSTYCFAQCTGLKSMTLPNIRVNIMAHMFEGCTSLDNVVLPDSVTTIQDSAFKNCSSLKSIKWSSSIAAIEQNAFENTNLQELILPATVGSIGKQAFMNCDNLGKAIIPDSVTTLGEKVFYDCDKLQEVSLGTGIQTIPVSAFENCDTLASMVLPYSIVSIGNNAFKDCVKFSEITILQNATNLSASAFSYPSILTIYGVSGSRAEAYASEIGAKFVPISRPVTSVELDQSELSLPKGMTLKLTAFFEPANFTDQVYWKSSDTSVVTVDNVGTIKAVSVGTATVSVVAGNHRASCRVTVLQPVTSISLNKTNLSLEAGTSFSLEATINPSNANNKSIVWSSSDESVAAVSQEGVVSALKKGTATITCTAQDGSGVSKSCTVTVPNDLIMVADANDLQSAHPYSVNCSDVWVYQQPGADSLKVTFSENTSVEDGSDYIYLYDAEGNQIGKYTGSELAGKTITIPGDTVKIKLVSDASYCEYGFAVTNVESTSAEHTHTLTAVPKVNATCTKDGTEAYWKCSSCGKLFSDAQGKNEISAPVVIKATGHKWDAGKVTAEPTETAEGVKTFTCTVCGETRTESIPSLSHTHTMTAVPKVNASCTKDGTEAYWKCSSCGKLFSDAQGKNEISAPAVIKATGHKWDSGKVTKQPTETAEGIKTFTCTVCGETRTESIPMLTPSTPANPFVDVKQGQYYYDPVLWAVNHQPQITNGTSATTFSPDATCTRGQVVTFLWRANGCPDPKSTSNPFQDVASGAYYYKAVLWAVENEITNGTSATTFSPEDPCTRAHVVTFLWRSANKPAAGSANPFNDVAAGQYYTDAVLWAVSKNITNGTSATTFSPDNPCTRGQIVTFLYRYMK